MEAHTVFNTLDYIVMGTILISGLLAIFSGFVREMYSLFNWSASAYLGSHFYRFAEPLVKEYISNPSTVADVSIFIVFCVFFIIFGVLGMFVTRLVKGNALTAIDRSLGFVFGLIRGVFMVCLIYLVVTLVLWPDLDKKPAVAAEVQKEETAKKDEPSKTESGKRSVSFSAPHWVMEARTRPLLARGANMLREFVPEKALEKTTDSILEKKDSIEKKVEGAVNKDDPEMLKEFQKE